MKIYNPSLLSTDITGSIRLTNEAAASLVTQLSSSLDDRYILSGSVSNADWDTLSNKPSNIVSESQDSTTVDFTITDGVITADVIGGVVSGSSQVDATQTTNFSTGVKGELNSNTVVSSSAQVVGILSSLNSYTSSNDTTNTTQNNRLDLLSTASASAIVRLNNIETFSGSVDTKFTTLATYTGSNDTTNTTQNNRLDLLSTASGSAITRLNNIESFTSSINTTIKTQLDSNTVVSGSSQISYTGLSNIPTGIVSASSQIDVTQTTNYNQVVQTTGDQTICGNKTFNNNVIVSGDLSVNGTVNYTSTCNFNVGDNIIELNYGGSATLGGIYVKDVSGTLTSGSLLWNSTTDRWIAGPSGSESNILLANGDGVVSGSSQITLAGDISGTANNTSITSNCIVNADVNTNAGIVYTKLNLNGSGLVSGSIQVDHNTTTNYVSNQHIDHSTVSISPGLGLSGGGNLTATRTLTLDTGSAHFISGSRSALPSGSVSGSSQITSLLPTGTISGSAQIQLNSTTGTLCVNKGGTGDTTYTNGQLLIGNTTGNTLAKATLTGTTNQVTVTNGAGSITLSTPQNTNTAASVQFGSFGVGTAASGTTGEIRATNEVTAFFSDDRLKTRLGKIEDALNKVKQLNGYYFVENEVAKSLGYTNDNRQVGVSAQEVQSVLPEVVTTAPISDEYLTVRYEKMIPLLIEAVKEQNNIVETLINEVEELKNLLNNRG